MLVGVGSGLIHGCNMEEIRGIVRSIDIRPGRPGVVRLEVDQAGDRTNDMTSYFLSLIDRDEHKAAVTMNGAAIKPAELLGALAFARPPVRVVLHPMMNYYGVSLCAEFSDVQR